MTFRPFQGISLYYYNLVGGWTAPSALSFTQLVINCKKQRSGFGGVCL